MSAMQGDDGKAFGRPGFKTLQIEEGHPHDVRFIVERKNGVVSVRPADDEPVQVLFTKAAFRELRAEFKELLAETLEEGTFTLNGLTPDLFKPPAINVHIPPLPAPEVTVKLVDSEADWRVEEP